MMKIFLIIATIEAQAISSIESIEMASLTQCSEIREALFAPGRILMCVESVVPRPERRPPK
jgi:hypothetical protein